MSGIGMVLNTAKLALSAQQQGIAVTGNNIANVNSPHYSRQTLPHSPREPVLYAGVYIGAGVEVEAVVRHCDQLLENRLMKQKSNLYASTELAQYLNILESSYYEDSESNIFNKITEFWNSWHDLGNQPAGTTERISVYEKGLLLAERFDLLYNDLLQMEQDLNSEIEAAITKINSITAEIAGINDKIPSFELNRTANELRDQRNALVTELSELIDVHTFEGSEGMLNVTTGRGYSLVSNDDAFTMSMSGNTVVWDGASSDNVDMGDEISGGKIKGWLEMRDEVVAKYKADLNSLAKEFIWGVNYQHSQGVGLEYFSSAVTGTYATDSTAMLSTLTYGDKIDYTKDFKMWIEDSTGASPTYASVTVDMALSSANPTYTGTFNTADTTYTFTITGGGTVNTDAIDFSWSEPGGGSGTATMGAGSTTVAIDGITLNFTAGDTLVSGNTLKVNSTAAAAAAPVTATPSGTANSMLDTYKFTVSSGGVIGTDSINVTWSNSITSGTFTLTAATTTVTVDGMPVAFTAGGRLADDDIFTITTDSSGNPTAQMMSDWHWTLDSFATQFNSQATGVTASKTSANKLAFTPGADYAFAFSDDEAEDSGLTAALGINTFFTGYNALSMGINSVINTDKDFVAAAKIDADNGLFGVGDSSNALDIADLQYTNSSFPRWTFQRGGADYSTVLSTTMEGYYRTMVGTIGIKSLTVSRAIDYNAAMVTRLTEQRDSISAVSLDEEMINLMKYQHAYTVAAKLISTADEMLLTLINQKQ